jgi:hypothetical protein
MNTGNRGRYPPKDWHAAFRDGIRLTFFSYRQALSFEFEKPLNTEPLRIDAIIVKKAPELVIDKPLGAVFRGHNIIEYKGPEDYLSVADYHKAGAYARLYSVLEGVEITDLTITLAGLRYPRKLLKRLRDVYGYTIHEIAPGIFQIEGEILGLQVVEMGRLREEDGGLWLRDLRGGLKGEELRGILEKVRGMPGDAPVSAYVDRVIRANSPALEEILKMSDITFDEVMEKYGIAARWEEKGLEKGLERDVKKLRKHGMDPAEIAQALELPSDTVSKYLGCPAERGAE